MNDTPKPRGFAAMTPERRSEIARKGGLSVPNEKRSFFLNRELASKAGAIGGKACPAEKRIFSINREAAVESGRRGGQTTKARRDAGEL